MSQLLYFSQTIYLFTADDFTSIVVPKTTCGILISLAGTLFQQPDSVVEVILRTPLVIFWIWINLLLFTVSNQSQAGAIEEDAENKPWRPIPAGRLTAHQAQVLIKCLYPVTISASLWLGGLYPCLALHILTYWYNELGGGETWLLRNLLNSSGYLSFIAGAIQVAMHSQSLEYTGMALKWFALIAMVISTTMHIQDLYDQEGDRLRDRKTVPLVFGDVRARHSIVIGVMAWSIIGPAVLKQNILGFMPTVAMGAIVATRLLDESKRSVSDDKRTFKLWSLWIISLYLLPLSLRLLGGLDGWLPGGTDVVHLLQGVSTLKT
ncbi:hypothetical protein MMC12_006681 [Toensbergia leucococca]|nr:hypothetical protein [Toensbergia leucococca]